MWYRFSSSARWSSRTPLGSPVVPPVYMRTTGSSSSGSGGGVGWPSSSKLLVPDVVRVIAVTDQHDRPQRELRADGRDDAQEVTGEERVDEDDLGSRVGKDDLKLLRREAQIEGVDDAAAQRTRRGRAPGTRGRWRPSRRTGPRARGCSSSSEGVGEAKDTTGVLCEGRVVLAVVEGDGVGPPLEGRQKDPAAD